MRDGYTTYTSLRAIDTRLDTHYSTLCSCCVGYFITRLKHHIIQSYRGDLESYVDILAPLLAGVILGLLSKYSRTSL